MTNWQKATATLGNPKANLEDVCCLDEVPTSHLIMAEQKSNYVSSLKQQRTPRHSGLENHDKSARWPCLGRLYYYIIINIK